MLGTIGVFARAQQKEIAHDQHVGNDRRLRAGTVREGLEGMS